MLRIEFYKKDFNFIKKSIGTDGIGRLSTLTETRRDERDFFRYKAFPKT